MMLMPLVKRGRAEEAIDYFQRGYRLVQESQIRRRIWGFYRLSGSHRQPGASRNLVHKAFAVSDR